MKSANLIDKDVLLTKLKYLLELEKGCKYESEFMQAYEAGFIAGVEHVIHAVEDMKP